ncbi:ATP-binding protein [Candidatus Parcubacteria bacterium]|nr:MAG: ATP-binding protein [Candidatus Parcubacteria bacterium]
MIALFSAQVTGLDATLINVEVDLSPGLHVFSIVGLADKEVQESRERIGVAIRAIGARPPHKKSERLIVNLAPADIRKEGPAFDLPIALGYLLASGQARFDPAGKLFIGELGLDGSLKPVVGVLPMAIAARLAGATACYVPPGNGAEAALIEGLTVKEAPNIPALLDDVEGRRALPPISRPEPPHGAADVFDISLIHGQEHAKRALVIAAAGGHNILFQGPPGTGKTILARALAGLLPPPTEDEMIEITKIASVAGILRDRGALVATRPFRSPHHSASAVAVTGGGSPPRPGEVTLAHRGVLFLDELPEFPTHVLESLRQPLEDRMITVARAAGTISFPADFTLIASMNPCPCGNLSNPRGNCICAPGAIARYRRRVSGPLLDRIDLHIEVGPVASEKLAADAADPSQGIAIRAQIAAARDHALKRFARSNCRTNAAMSLVELKTFCPLDAESRHILQEAYDRLGMSVRTYYRTIKVARTIADLAASPGIRSEHVLEALQYRPMGER